MTRAKNADKLSMLERSVLPRSVPRRNDDKLSMLERSVLPRTQRPNNLEGEQK